jgi:NTP pyrophosphatase (non-canonical NTP hydrolase)
VSGRSIGDFQRTIEALYLERDRRRGTSGTFLWFAEEVGELARAIKRGDAANLREEVGDVLAWLSTLASLVGVDLEEAAARYAKGCPRCGRSPCACPERPLATYPRAGDAPPPPPAVR